MNFTHKLAVAIAVIVATAVIGAVALYITLNLPEPVCSCSNPRVLYQGIFPSKLSIVAETAILKINTDSGVSKAAISFVECGNCIEAVASVNNNTLHVKVENKCHISFGCSKAVIQVILPNRKIEELNLHLGVGEAIIDSISAETIMLKADVGEIVAKNIKASRKLVAVANVGKIHMEHVDVNANATVYLKTKTGNIKLILNSPGAKIIQQHMPLGLLDTNCKPLQKPLVNVEATAGTVTIKCAKQ